MLHKIRACYVKYTSGSYLLILLPTFVVNKVFVLVILVTRHSIENRSNSSFKTSYPKTSLRLRRSAILTISLNNSSYIQKKLLSLT